MATWCQEQHHPTWQGDPNTKSKIVVYAKDKKEIEKGYEQFLKSPEVQRYPHYSKYIQTMWPYHKEWAFCYQKRMRIRGNHTNNYAEAGMRILNKLVFSSIKAYNTTQIFHLITETIERYYKSKLLGIRCPFHCGKGTNRPTRHVHLQETLLKDSKIQGTCTLTNCFK